MNSLPLGQAKHHSLRVLSDTATRSANDSLSILRSEKPRTRTAFHHLVYDGMRAKALPSQLACDVVSQVWEGRKTARNFRSVPLRFNLPRSASFAETGKGNPVLTLCLGEKRRTAIPLSRDGAYARYAARWSDGFTARQIRVCRRGGEFRFWVLMEKSVPDPVVVSASPVVGVDLGVRTLAAVSVVGDRGISEQHYLGRDLYPAQRDAGLRRSILQEGRATGAMPDRSLRGLRRLRGWEDRFTTTRCWQVAHQVVALAEKHGAAIAIEDLQGLRQAPGNHKSRRKTARLPYSKFRSSLESLALERDVPLVAVPLAYTPRRCSRCGEMGNRKAATFRCPGCGYLGNADRNASVNIATSLRERGNAGVSNLSPPQISRRGGRVNGPVGNEDGSGGVSSQLYHPPEFKPPISIGGR
ncbi:MAG: RNA-guided endonuclease TnpB family protein [Thermoplasmata archaeon]